MTIPEIRSLEKIMDQQYGSINTTLFDIKAQQDKFEKKVDAINDYITTSKISDAISEATHYFNCPLNKDLKILEAKVDFNKKDRDDKSADVDYFSRHPKHAFYAIAVIFVIVGISIITAWTGYNTLATNIKTNKANIEQTDKAVAPIVEKERKSIIHPDQ